jgi:hypothetical protein
MVLESLITIQEKARIGEGNEISTEQSMYEDSGIKNGS